MSVLKFSPGLGRLMRQDRPDHLGAPTRSLLDAALRGARPEEARQWVDYFFFELANIRYIFGVWNWHMAAYYLDRAGRETWPRLMQESMAPWIGTTAGVKNGLPARVATEGGNAHLTVPGLSWTVHVTERDRQFHLTLNAPVEQEARWSEWRSCVETALRAGDAPAVGRLMDVHTTEARLIHDVLCDWAWALLTVIGRTWGEEALGGVLRVTEEPWVTVRYEKIRELSVLDALRLTVEGMRGHLSGPERRGEISVVEERDRYVLSFDACGTGGRMRRGDPVSGSGSRLEAPYNFLNIAGAYDWTWKRKGVCAYCAHCAMVNQILPIEKLGRPMRMTLYPASPSDPCRWVIYKDPHDFPDDAFTEVGLTKRTPPGTPPPERPEKP
jgi:hypothetical protein